MEEIKQCFVCGGSSFEHSLRCKDYTVSGESFNIDCCKQCGFLFTNPRPEQKFIGRYYASTDYISHSDTSGGIINRVYKQVRRITLRNKYRLIKPFLSENRLLDIGAGTGYFLKYCQEKGVSVAGIEPDSGARDLAEKLQHLRLLPEEDLASFPDGSFSVITMWHVLEHVHDLNERIQEIHRLLSKDGKLIVAVPNHLSYDAQYYGVHWAAYDVPRHLYHFDPKSIQTLFLKHGFQLEQIRPMRWDAFYVSLLSEQYKNGKPGYLNALFRGILSNLKGKYSSQIYILSKKAF